jgi:hypothetical protein
MTPKAVQTDREPVAKHFEPTTAISIGKTFTSPAWCDPNPPILEYNGTSNRSDKSTADDGNVANDDDDDDSNDNDSDDDIMSAVQSIKKRKH